MPYSCNYSCIQLLYSLSTSFSTQFTSKPQVKPVMHLNPVITIQGNGLLATIKQAYYSAAAMIFRSHILL